VKRNIKTWKSKHLGKEVSVAIYGHYGFALLLFPSITDNFLENEESGLIKSLKPYIDKGKFTAFSIGGVNFDSWLNDELSNEEKSKKHFDYNQFIVEEVLPMMFGQCGGPVPIIVCGAALGGYHAANIYFKRPDLFYGVISISATYNIEHITNGFFDEKIKYFLIR